jgi:hypothetical protein
MAQKLPKLEVEQWLFVSGRRSVMSPIKILVSLMASAKDLKSVHYAMSLAERLSAHLYILQQAAVPGLDNPHSTWMEEALLDLINSARQAGLMVSHHIILRHLEEEIVSLVREEGIDVLVFGDDDGAGERLVLQIKPLVPSQIIQVKGKGRISYLNKEDKAKWRL